MTILARLTDSNGFPIANVVVDSESDSGRAGNVVPTNSNGVVAFSAAEREVRAIYVDGVCVFESDGILSPSIQYGLVVSIRMLNDSTQTTTKTNNGLQQSARPAVLTYVESTARTR